MKYVAAMFFGFLLLAFGGEVLARTSPQALVDQMMVERAATLASMSRQFEAREQELLNRSAQRVRQIAAALRAAGADDAARVRLEGEIAQLAAECAEIAARLGGSFPDFTADLAAYREAVTSIANSSDPRRVAALERYAAGDRAGALTVLAQIQEAESRAVGAGWREIGALALDMRDRGERTTSQVSQIFAQAQRLDPSNSSGTRQLVQLYMEEHRYADAGAALATHQRNQLPAEAHAQALVLQGQLEYETGENRRARATLQQAITAYEQLRRADLNNIPLRQQWLQANNQLLLSFEDFGQAASQTERATLARQRGELAVRLAQAVNDMPAYERIEQPATIYEISNIACGLTGYQQNLDASALQRMNTRCTQGASALQQRFPGTYFAQRASLSAALASIVGSGGQLAQVNLDQFPQLIAMTRELIARDPDAISLVNHLASLLMIHDMLSRMTGATNSAAMSQSLQQAHETFEQMEARGRLSPAQRLRVAAFYFAASMGQLTPPRGVDYAQRANALLNGISAEAPQGAEIHSAVTATRQSWAQMQAMQRMMRN